MRHSSSRGAGSTCNTAKYQKTTCSSCGVFRSSSTTARAVHAASGLADNRISASATPSAVASRIASAAASRVFSPATQSARP